VRIAITSDIHANLVALEAVLADAGPVDGIWNTGDAVGYGPQPRECIARLREAGAVWVAGNHERAATGAISTDEFNPAAAEAAQWTGAQLTGDDKAFLDALPEVALQGDLTLCHGTLRDPIWEYLDDGDAALAHLALQRTKFGIVGHTHVPALVSEMSDTYQIDDLSDGEVVALTGAARFVLNAGSVGQPRDGDKRASYGIFDSDAATFTLHRVEYDIAQTQALMVDAGLPDWLIERLAIGR
jgi:diadenosine tetraphosphatase ApaH/serine/threonine PP2A family protein phosphatase